MSRANCFRCHENYNSNDPDDIAGDGKCAKCKELSKKIAFEVDLKMAAIRRASPLSQADPVKREWIERGGIIKARDLGITFQPD